MKHFSRSAILLVLSAAISLAATTFDFTTGANITAPPSPLGVLASTYSGAAATLGTTTLLLGPGATLTGSAILSCVDGTSPVGCFSGTITTGNTAGLGVMGGGSDARLDGTETFTITANPGYTVTLVDFSLAGYSTGETFTYNLGGGAIGVVAGASAAVDSYTINSGAFSTLVFQMSAGNANLTSLTLNITANATPEPATYGMVGMALVGLATLRRRVAKR